MDTSITNYLSSFNLTNPNVSNFSASAIIISIVGVLTVVYILYISYKYIINKQSREPVFITRPLSSKEARVVPAEKMPKMESGTEYTLSFWINVQSLLHNIEEYNTILEVGSLAEHRVQPWIGFSNKPEKPLAICMSLRDGQLAYHEIGVLPIRKWVQISITVENEVCSVYRNGKLEKVIRLSQPILALTSPSMYIHKDPNTYDGAITQLQMRSYVMSSGDIRREYMRGPAPWRLSPLEWPYIIPRIQIKFDVDINEVNQ